MWSSSVGQECPECGLRVPAHYLAAGMHTCRPENVLERQIDQARLELEHLEDEIAEYLTTPRAQTLLAFSRWCREHGC